MADSTDSHDANRNAALAYQTRFNQGQLTIDEARDLERSRCNTVRQIDMVLKAVKPG